MSDVRFLDRSIVLAIHEEQLAQHGGGVGLRDDNLFEPAPARPLNLFAREPNADVAALAAAYAFGLARDHPFIDGNKRTAYVAMELFPVDNGFVLNASDEDSLMAMLGFAAGDIDEAAFARWLRANGAATPA